MKKINRLKLVFISFLLLLSVVFAVLIFWQQIKQQLFNVKVNTLEAIDQRQQNTFIEINNFPTGAADDVLFLSKLINVGDVENVKNDFLEFLTKSEAYYQISYIDENGELLITAESDGKTSNVKEISEEDRVNSSKYFGLLKDLKKEEVYIFPIDMELLPRRNAILKYATAIFDKKTNKLDGIILVKVYADYLLNDIRRSKRDGEVTYLINSKGIYLANPEKAKEFGDDNFFSDYPEISKKITDCESRRFETDKKIFTYRCINPNMSNFEIYNGSKTINGTDEGNYQWLLVTVTEKKSLESSSLKTNSIWWVIFIQTMINGLIFILIFLNEKK